MPSLPVEATQVPGLRGGKVVSRCPAIGSSRGPPAVKTRRGSKNLVRPPTENPEEPYFCVSTNCPSTPCCQPYTAIAFLQTIDGPSQTTPPTDVIGVSSAAGVWTLQTPLQITTTSIPNATSGQPYSTTLTALGGSGSGYTWSVSSGTLPT